MSQRVAPLGDGHFPSSFPPTVACRWNGALRIAQTVETAYCKAKPTYYGKSCSNVTWDLDKPASLDFEFKVLEDGRFVAKQVREFSGQ